MLNPVQNTINAGRNKMVDGKVGTSSGKHNKEYFKLLKEFNFTVPIDYSHVTQLATFTKQFGSKFHYFDYTINDENFSNVTCQLEKGSIYTVKIFAIKERITSEDCLNFLKSCNAILTGAQGASLLWQEKKDKLPADKLYLSFDEKDALWLDIDGKHRVPMLSRDLYGGWRFGLGRFEVGWFETNCLICFCE